MIAARAGRMTGIAALADADRPAVRRHLMRLDGEDRAARFGMPAGDDALAAYVDSIVPGEALGLFIDGALVGLSHLPASAPRERELGLSVDAALRAHGWGRVLFETSLVRLSSSDVEWLVVHHARGNRPMARLLQGVPHTRESYGGWTTARLGLDDWARSQSGAGLIEGAA